MDSTAKYHEAVANHFSLAINDNGTKFLMNPDQSHFARIKASDIIEVDANNPDTLSGPNAPDPTAWGLHGSSTAAVPMRDAPCMCILSTQLFWHRSKTAGYFQLIKTAQLYNRYVIDDNYGGLALEDEGSVAPPCFKIQRKNNDHGKSRCFGDRRKCRGYIQQTITLSARQKHIFGLCKLASPFGSFVMRLLQRWQISLTHIPNRSETFYRIEGYLDEEGSNYSQ